ncbi:MAG: glycosyltransferase [Verrucomicrobia bacterium]|nr:glycosyltransferase [Leptolyngbya sp. ES-bin-22]
MQPTYSFIVPVFNEEATLMELYRRLNAVMDSMDGTVELVLVDDGSHDRSLAMMRDLHEHDRRVCYLSFARNFGHQIAVTAGLNFARGQAIVVLDADLQDPPELIPELADKWRRGYDVVYAQRVQRHQEGWFKRLTAYLFYRLLRQLADVDMPTDTGDFCLMDRRVVDALNAMPERNRYIRGLRSWLGFRQIAIPFERDSRFAGEVKYTFRKSLALAIDGLVSFSKVPLRISTYVGLFAAIVAIVMAILVLYWRFFSPISPLTGFATIAVAIFFLGAVQLFSIGILGEYIGRIYEEVKNRPVYILGEVSGFEPSVTTRHTATSVIREPHLQPRRKSL